MKKAPQPYIKESVFNSLPFFGAQTVFEVSDIFNSQLPVLHISDTRQLRTGLD